MSNNKVDTVSGKKESKLGESSMDGGILAEVAASLKKRLVELEDKPNESVGSDGSAPR
jgi:hypothetical protein